MMYEPKYIYLPKSLPFSIKAYTKLPPIWIPIKWENILFSSNEVIRSNKNGEVAKSLNSIIQSLKQDKNELL